MHLRRKPCGWYAWGHSRIRNRVEPSIASNNRKDKLTFRIKLMCCMNVPWLQNEHKDKRSRNDDPEQNAPENWH